MTQDQFTIREIQPEDNPQIATAIREVLIEYGVPKIGTTYADVILDKLYETYRPERKIYYVIVNKGNIVGGGGFMQLDNYEGNVCELQKMYFMPVARGFGLGSKLLKICLSKALEYGFEHCYLETMPYMKEARILYNKAGFEKLDKPLGDTGHYSCNLWMIKKLI